MNTNPGPAVDRKKYMIMQIIRYLHCRRRLRIFNPTCKTTNLTVENCGAMVADPTSEAGVRFPAWPQVRKLVVVCRWSTGYSTEP